MKYILGIDQSTQGTKALLIDEEGRMCAKAEKAHRQIINEAGWVSHDLNEIYDNVMSVIRTVIEKADVQPSEVKALGISNQRETSCIWDRKTGKPLADAVVWQCSRATDICAEVEKGNCQELIRKATGLQLSPYFPASKFAWLLRNTEVEDSADICLGTVDSYLVYRLTDGRAFKTDYSNASRTQLFNLHTLQWDAEICDIFGIRKEVLPEVCDSDAVFGETTLDGYFPTPVPISSVLGDSHAALFGQGCIQPGMIKATIGTGSSVMMNIGDQPVISDAGIVTSIAYGRSGRVEYVFEGNINYAAAVVTWLKDDLGLIKSPGETEALAKEANPEDVTYLIPAFTGLGAPYWDNNARAAFIGMSRLTGKRELVRAALESIAYQIRDILDLMQQEAGVSVQELRTDGGAARNGYLAQFQSDIGHMRVAVADTAELSGIGAAYMAGIRCGILKEDVQEKMGRTLYRPVMDPEKVNARINGWKEALAKCRY